MIANPKPRPKFIDKREAAAKKLAEDIAENKIVKARSTGQCEVLVVHRTKPFWIVSVYDVRCKRRASHVHHLISGIGRRGRGVSIKAEHKLHICESCHDQIHGHVLKPENEYGRYHAATVKYEREK